MRLFLRLLILIVVLIALLVGLAFVLPDRAHVERSVTVLRPPSQIYLLLTNLRRFNDWSPWFQRDPGASYVFSGPGSGVGATLSWRSERGDVGVGRQTLAAAVPDESVTFELDFGVRGRSSARFDLVGRNGETRVTWRLDSELPLHLDERFGWNVVGRYMGLFMDRLVGPDFELGLANLKQLVERFPNVDIAGVAPQLVDLPARRFIYVAFDAGVDDAAIVRQWNGAVAQLTRFAVQNQLPVGGAPLRLTQAAQADAGRIEVALPVHYDLMADDAAVRGRELAAVRAAQLVHSGNAAERRKLVDKLRAWIVVTGLHADVLLIEEQVDGDFAQGTTRLSIPLRREGVEP